MIEMRRNTKQNGVGIRRFQDTLLFPNDLRQVKSDPKMNMSETKVQTIVKKRK